MSNVNNIAKSNTPFVECRNCGAQVDYSVRFCPYCGSANEIGEELFYQEKLEDIRENMENLGDIPNEMVKSEVSRNAKTILKIMLITVSVLFVIGAAYMIFRSYYSHLSDIKTKEDIAWQKETFAMLDDMYDRDDFESISAFYDDYYLSLGWEKHSLYDWPHNDFIIAYRLYEHMLNTIDDIDRYPDILPTGKVDVFEDAVMLIESDWQKSDYRNCLTAKDYENISKYQKHALEILSEHFKISEDDLNAMRNDLFDAKASPYSPNGNMCREKGKQLVWY